MNYLKTYERYTQSMQDTNMYKPVYTADLEEYKDKDVEDDPDPDPNSKIVKDAKTKKVKR
jgi:hypothetical protein